MGGRCDALVSGVGLWVPALCAALLALLVALLALGFARWPTWSAPGRAGRGDLWYTGGTESLLALWCLSRQPGARDGTDAGRVGAVRPTAGPPPATGPVGSRGTMARGG
jgi:hypothetical protein